MKIPILENKINLESLGTKLFQGKVFIDADVEIEFRRTLDKIMDSDSFMKMFKSKLRNNPNRVSFINNGIEAIREGVNYDLNFNDWVLTKNGEGFRSWSVIDNVTKITILGSFDDKVAEGILRDINVIFAIKARRESKSKENYNKQE